MITIVHVGRFVLASVLSVTTSICFAEIGIVGSALTTPAMQVVAPSKAVFIDLARAADRLVAVGERGLIVLSDDNGQSWRQVPVPVSVSLSAVYFADDQRGWAVGHAGTVLATLDGGEHWTVQLSGLQAAQIELQAAQAEKVTATDAEAADMRLQNAERLIADGPDKPFLAVRFSDAKQGLVVGAYGMAFATQDGGASWHSLMGRIENPSLVHLYAIAQRNNFFFLAGEQGYLARSVDSGQSFKQLESPYDGSFFTAQVRDDGALLVAGLKGHAYLSTDDGDSFQPIAVSSPVSFSSSVRLADGTLLFANQAGGIFSSAASQGAALQSVGSFITAGFAGLSRFAHPTTDVSE
jgi:photosystem II stability/assembly factor-like uncharacterized protein